MTDLPDEPLARKAFDALATGYDREGDTKPTNAFLERPAMLDLLPAVEGNTVLDAGCGAGHLTNELTARDASVVGLDVSRRMVGSALARTPEADFVQADLGGPLPFADDVFDGVVSSLAFHYVREWDALFAELRRVLSPGGWLLVSVQHPHADFEEYAGAENYHERERVEATWESFGPPVTVPAYRRALAAMFDPALANGFRLDRLVEPTPTDAYRAAAPERYAYEARRPNFLCLRFSADRTDLSEPRE